MYDPDEYPDLYTRLGNTGNVPILHTMLDDDPDHQYPNNFLAASKMTTKSEDTSGIQVSWANGGSIDLAWTNMPSDFTSVVQGTV